MHVGMHGMEGGWTGLWAGDGHDVGMDRCMGIVMRWIKCGHQNEKVIGVGEDVLGYDRNGLVLGMEQTQGWTGIDFSMRMEWRSGWRQEEGGDLHQVVPSCPGCGEPPSLLGVRWALVSVHIVSSRKPLLLLCLQLGRLHNVLLLGSGSIIHKGLGDDITITISYYCCF